MLTYLKTIFIRQSDLAYKLHATLRAGFMDYDPFNLPPSGMYDVYRQGGHVVLCPKGQDPHDYSGTFYYVSIPAARMKRRVRMKRKVRS